MLRKLTMIVMGIFLVLCAGACNIYPLYLKLMMDKYGFSLRAVNSFGSSINLGLWVAFTMGFVYDKYGPKFSCILGAILLCGSYVVLYFILTSSIVSINIFFFIIIGLIMGQGSALCYTTAITTNLKNFKIKETSIIVGLLVANMAISPSIFTTYREYLENLNIANYFLIISIFLLVIIVICGILFTNIKDLYSHESKLMDYQKYKEKNVIFLLLILNFVTLIIYIFGVMYNHSNSNSSFPNFIVYPCLQSLNFGFLIMERLKVFDYFYFREFINKEVQRKIHLDDINFRNEMEIKKQEDINIAENAGDFQENNQYSNKSENIPEEKSNNENISRENSNSLVSSKMQQPNQRKSIKYNDKIKSARNSNIDIRSKIDIGQSFNYQYENVNGKNIDNQIDNLDEENNFEKDEFKNKNSNNKRLNTTMGELQDKKILNFDKLDNLNVQNLNFNKTNANFESGIEKTANKLVYEKYEVKKKSNDFQTLEEESKEESFNNQETDKNNSIYEKNIIHINIDKDLGGNKEKSNDIKTEDHQGESKLEQNMNNSIENKQNDNSSNDQSVNANQSSPLINVVESEYKRFFRLITAKEVSILFIILVLGVGSVIGNLNNIEFIISSISKNTSSSDIFEYAVLYFSFNSLSRLASGIIIDKLILYNKIFFFLLATSIFGLISQIFGILMTREYLIISICLAGCTHGAYLTFAPIYTKNFFDLNDMGKILGFLTTGAAIGSVFVGNLIFTIFYEVFKRDGVCKGQRCFMYSYIITTVMFVINIGLSFYLMRIMSQRIKKSKKRLEEKI